MNQSTRPMANAPPASWNNSPNAWSGVGFFQKLCEAEYAVTALRSVGFPLNQITLVAKEFPREDSFAGINLRDRFEPDELRIPAEHVRPYQARFEQGEYMIGVQGTEAELNHAWVILNHRGIGEWQMYGLTVVNHQLTRETASTENVNPASSSLEESDFTRSQQIVGFFCHRQDAESAMTELRMAGFPLGQVSLIAQRFDNPQRFAGVDLRDRLNNTRFGFPPERVRFFNNRIARGNYFVVVHGTPKQLQQAEVFLRQAHIDDFDIYDLPKIADDPSDDKQDGASTNRSTNDPVEQNLASDADQGDGNTQPEQHPVTIVAQREETYSNG